MIHVAIPDTVGDGLINFDKKRKEFEILAQIKLLQGAANTYNLKSDHHFDRWFASMLVLDERESHQISCQIEPPPETTKKSSLSTSSSMTPTATVTSSTTTMITNNNSVTFGHGLAVGMGVISGVINSTTGNSGHKKSNSVASNSSNNYCTTATNSQIYNEINTTSSSNISNNKLRYNNSSKHNSLDRDATQNSSISPMISTSSSISNLSIDSNNSNNGQKSSSSLSIISNLKILNNNKNSNIINDTPPIINAQLVQTSSSSQMKNNVPDFYIIRVTYETNNPETNGIVLYKSIMLCNNERTPQVIRNAMMKLGLDGDPDKWTLSQVLPDKELIMPPNANVYYAVNTAYNLNFILRHKKDYE